MPYFFAFVAIALLLASPSNGFDDSHYTFVPGSGSGDYDYNYDNTIPQFFTIGALIPQTSEPTGESEWKAFQFAVDDVNNDTSVLPNVFLTPKSYDTSSDTWRGFEYAVGLNQDKAVAVVGPGLSTVARVISPLATRTKVPFVTPTATSLALSLHEVHRYVLQLCPSSRLESEIMVDLVSHFQWKYVAVVRSEDEYGRSSLLEFESLAYEKDIRIIDTVEVQAWTGVVGNETEIVDLMAKSMRNLMILKTRAFVLSVQDSQLLYVFKAAKNLGLIGPEFVWLVNGLESPADVLSDELKELMRGALAVSTSLPDKADQWRTKHNTNTTSAFELYTYDAVWLIARGLDRFLQTNNNSIAWSDLPNSPGSPKLAELVDGDVLLESIQNVTFEGESGSVAFDGVTGERMKAYNIVNMFNSTFTRVGDWTPSGATEDKRLDVSKKFPSVRFYNGSSIPPPDRDDALDQKIYILVTNNAPYSSYVANKDGTETDCGGRFNGYVIDILKQLSKDIGFKCVLEQWNGTYNELIYYIASPNNPYTMAVGDITVTTKREALVDFTTSYHTSGLGVMIPRPELRAKAGMWGFLAPFDYGVWLLLLVFFFFGAVVLYLTESNRAYHPALKFGEALWISFSAFFGTHKDDKVTSLPGRAWLLVMLLSLLVINAAYTAVLTTFLLSKEIVAPINQVDDLINVPVGVQSGGTNFLYLQGKLHQLQAVKNEDAVGNLTNEDIEAFIADRPILEYIALTDCNVYVTDIEFQRQQLGFPIQRGSALKKPISERIQSYWESGLLSQLYSRHFVWASKCNNGNELSEVDTIKLTEIAGIFVVLAVTTVICVVGNFLQKRFCKGTTWIDRCCIGEDPDEFYAKAMEREEVNESLETVYANGNYQMKERPSH